MAKADELMQASASPVALDGGFGDIASGFLTKDYENSRFPGVGVVQDFTLPSFKIWRRYSHNATDANSNASNR